MENHEATNPYVGPVAFRPDQGGLFFGREREAKKLLALTASTNLGLFYAPSGAGKTSLINTRLIPALREEGTEVLPVARVGGEVSPAFSPPNVYVFNILDYLTQDDEDPQRLEGLQATSLREFFARDGERRPRLLIIDQFEEVVTAHPEHRAEREEFFQQLRDAVTATPLLTVLLAMREDHLAALDPYAPLLPGRLRSRFRMERLRPEAAVKAVRGPAEQAGRPFAEGVAEKLVDDLRQEHVAGRRRTIGGEFVEPVQLQVVCFRLWEGLRKSSGQEITAADLAAHGDVDRALEGFFDQAVKRAARGSGVSESRIVRWFCETLITPTGIRCQVHEEEKTTGGLPNKAIRELDSAHLIRPETARGATWYELVHDRFVEPIRASNRRRAQARIARALRWSAALLAIALVAFLVYLGKIRASQREQQALDLAQEARDALARAPEKGLRLALEAAETTYRPDQFVAPVVEDTLRRALDARRTRAVAAGRAEDVLDLALSAGGRHLATGHRDGTVNVWETDSGAKVATLRDTTMPWSRFRSTPPGPAW